MNDPFSELWSPHRFKVFYGGRGSGKSWAIAEALVVMSNLSRLRVLCSREFQNSIADSSYQLLKAPTNIDAFDRLYRLHLSLLQALKKEPRAVYMPDLSL